MDVATYTVVVGVLSCMEDGLEDRISSVYDEDIDGL